MDMYKAILQLCLPFLLVAIGMFVLAGFIWLFFNHGIDKIRHPEEWKDQGSSGERIIYRTLVDQIHVPESQILRNVYVPTVDGKTSEIDLLVVSKKGLLVFECKNYAGNIYGDASRKKWIQYLGKKKSFFYNPFMQNRTHVKHLKKYLEQYGDIPAIPMVTTITRGTWKVKNYGPEDYLLGYNCHLKDVLARTPDSELMAQHFKAILAKLQPLSRPDESVKKEHIEKIRKK
ncbi:nuclease-related domain-containing protein [Lactimicrobium massiliense]|uniref:nuclease-related domain-containing protein n=1 Tax=Lactimicrobium massiliense TaxID=2161814 RepID=UPI000D554A8E|nr:nuclease-related domain-containing protein [Lactimicrobium massiliense]